MPHTTHARRHSKVRVADSLDKRRFTHANIASFFLKFKKWNLNSYIEVCDWKFHAHVSAFRPLFTGDEQHCRSNNRRLLGRLLQTEGRHSCSRPQQSTPRGVRHLPCYRKHLIFECIPILQKNCALLHCTRGYFAARLSLTTHHF